MAKTNFAMNQFNSQKLLKAQIQKQQTAFNSVAFDNSIEFKPIKWIGTQRTEFTHRKRQKRIKELLAKANDNKQRNISA